MQRAMLTVGLTAFLVCAIACGGSGKRGDTGGRPAASAETQAERSALIEKLTREGVVKSVSMERKRVVVGARFAGLDHDIKQKFMGVVAGYVFEVPANSTLHAGEIMLIADPKTDKTIGTFTSEGLDLD